jgi:hypothetical protein
MLRVILLVVAALVLLPILFKLIAFATGVAFGLLQVVILLAIVIFVVGLVRRLLLMR